MNGVHGLGSRGLPTDASPVQRAVAGDLDHLGLQVTPENVLQVRNALRGEASRLADVVANNEYRLHIRPHAADPVSLAATPLFNQKIDALRAEWYGYIDALDQAGIALEQTARDYGHAEQTIADSFNSYLAAHQPGWDDQSRSHAAVQELPEPMRSLVEPDPEAPPTGRNGFPGIFDGAR